MKRVSWILMTMMLAILAILISPIVLAQGGEVEPTNTEYLALLFNVGVVMVLVQLAKWKVLPFLKTRAPYAIPIIGMVLGIAGAWVLQMTGIDISAIGDIFGAGIASGALASTGFAIVKEASNVRRGKV